MKVICIDGSTDLDSPLPVDVVEGNIYTVIDVVHYSDGVWYELAEMEPGDVYTADCFAPISDIDETEMIREYKKELV